MIENNIIQKEQQQLIFLYQQGQHRNALTKARALWRDNPGVPFFPNFIGVVSASLGLFDEAVGSYREAIRLKPDDAGVYNNLGYALGVLGRTQEAIDCLRQAIKLNPSLAEAHCNLGTALRLQGRLQDAVASLRQSIQLKPNYPVAHYNLGNALNALGNSEAAITSLRQAIAFNPNYAKPYNDLGVIYYDRGQPEEAIACYRKAIALKPDYAEPYNNLGIVLNDQGNMSEAISSYQKALAIKPDYPSCYRNLSLAKKYTPGDPQISELCKRYEESRHDADKIQISFALGKIFEDLGEFDRAFAHYSEANALRKCELGYQIDLDHKLFQKIKTLFTRHLEVISIPVSSPLPILIVGMPRSGTSLVEQILASHSTVYGGGELDHLSSLAQQHLLMAQANKDFDIADACRQVASEYLRCLSSSNREKPVITDKMPVNFLWIGCLLSAMPQIRIVNVVRDPRAVCWSLFKHYFPAKWMGFANDLGDLAEYFQEYEELMQFWKKLFPNRIYDLCYERLTENQEQETRNLLNYCDLAWEDRCLEFHKTARVVRTASAAQVRKPMYRSSSEAWRNFEKHLEPLSHRLGLSS